MKTDTQKEEIDLGTTEIVCRNCGTHPRLKSLNKNAGTVTGCDCDGAKYSKDMVPYELTVGMLPDAWELVEADGEQDQPDSGPNQQLTEVR